MYKKKKKGKKIIFAELLGRGYAKFEIHSSIGRIREITFLYMLVSDIITILFLFDVYRVRIKTLLKKKLDRIARYA